MSKNDNSPVNQSFLLDTQSQLLMSTEKYEQALEILTQLSQSATADGSVFLHLAECHRKMGKTAESQQAFAIAQQLGISTSLLPPMDKRMVDSLTETYSKTPGSKN